MPVAVETGWWTYWVSVQRDITEAKQREHSIQAQRDTLRHTLSDLSRERRVDVLTGFGNQHALLAWASERPGESETAILSIEVDGLGGIKGTYGQRIAEAVVKTIASRLKTTAQRRNDLVLCLGEGELAIV